MARCSAWTRELYISVDIEPDGHVPGTSSIVSLGACAAAVRDVERVVHPLDPDDERNARATRCGCCTRCHHPRDRERAARRGRPDGRSTRARLPWR